MPKFFALGLLFVFFLPLQTFAQTPFTSPDRSFTMTYPSEWEVVFSTAGVYSFVSTPDINPFLPSRLESGQASVQVLLPDVVEANDMSADMEFFLVNFVANFFEAELTSIDTLEINGRNALQAIGSAEDFDIQMVGLPFPDGNVVFLAITAPGELDAFAPQFDAMLASITYTAPEPYTLAELEPITPENIGELERLLYIPNTLDDTQWLETWLSDDGGTIILNVNGINGSEDSLRAYDTVTGEPRWDYPYDFPELTIGYTVYDFTSAGDQLVVEAAPNDEDFVWYLDVASGLVINQVALANNQSLLAASDALYAVQADNTRLEIYTPDGVKFEQDVPNLEAVVFSPDGTRMIAHTADYGAGVFEFYLYDVASLSVAEPAITLTDLPANISAETLQISPDGNLLAFTTIERSSHHVLDLATGEIIYAITRDEIGRANFAFDATGEMLMLLGVNQILSFVDLANGTIINQMMVEGEGFFRVSQDGRVMSISGNDDILILGIRAN